MNRQTVKHIDPQDGQTKGDGWVLIGPRAAAYDVVVAPGVILAACIH